MRYKLDSISVKFSLLSWALPLQVVFSRKDKGYVKYGVLVQFLCFWIYIGVCDTQWVKDKK